MPKKASQTASPNLPEWIANPANPQTDIPRIAKDRELLKQIELAVQQVPTHHRLYHGDSRNLSFIPDESVHLVVTSPPYWTLKKYRDHAGQLGDVQDYEEFLRELGKVWVHCYRVLVPGGRLVCVVGDVCLARRKNRGRHTVVPLHASIQEHCRKVGFDNLAPIIWYKIANAVFEASGNGSGFLGKPYEPNAVIKNDIEFILMERKPGGYRRPSVKNRVLSIISEGESQEMVPVYLVGIGGSIDPQPSGPLSEGTGGASDTNVQLCRRYHPGSFHGNRDHQCRRRHLGQEFRWGGRRSRTIVQQPGVESNVPPAPCSLMLKFRCSSGRKGTSPA